MRPSTLRLHFTGVLLVTLTTTSAAQASRTVRGGEPVVRRVAGSVLDTAGAPVPLADIRLTGSDGWRDAIQTDGAGHFAFVAVPAGPVQLDVRRMGYRPFSRLLAVASTEGLDSTRIVLAAIAAELVGIAISDEAPERDGALAAFNARRKSNNFGHYLNRTEIEATHAQRPSEALRAVPGVQVAPSRRLGNTIRFRNCRPTVWIDGIRIADAELDEVANVDDVAAVEIYNSLAGLPQQFIDRTNPCGGILVWSRNR